MHPTLSSRLLGVLMRPVRTRALLVAVGVCGVLIALGDRRVGHVVYLGALVTGVGALVLIPDDLLHARRKVRPFAFGDLTQLRRLRRRDVHEFAETIDDTVIAENHWAPFERDAYIRAVRNGSLPNVIAVCERRTGTIVGTIVVRKDAPQELGVGMWVGPSHRGRGYMTDALSALLGVIHESDCTSVTASTAETNTVMQSVLRRVGFVEEERYAHEFADGETTPAIRFRFAVSGSGHGGDEAA